MFRATFAFAASLLAAASAAAGPIVTDTATFNGHTYYLLSTSSWTDAEAAAITLGGHLATINNAAENNFLSTQWGQGANAKSLWIGFKRFGPNPTDFAWVSGEPTTFTNWNGGEPNNVGGIEFYTHLLTQSFGGGRWNDLQNTDTTDDGLKFGVVEVNAIPEPATLAVFGGIALAGALGYLRRKATASV